MKNIRLHIVMLVFWFIAIAITASAQSKKDTISFYKKDIYKRKGYCLIFINKDSSFSAVTKQRLIDLFFKVYPEEVKRFNRKVNHTVTFVIDSAYDGVAATSGDVVTYNPKWLTNHPEDIDAATHELMHVVQAYKNNDIGWLIEGIADYGRYVFGVNNDKAGWSLTPLRKGQRYTDAYRVTARFLVWVEKRYNPDLVNVIDKAMRKGSYSPELWETLTHKSIDELWSIYTADPSID